MKIIMFAFLSITTVLAQVQPKKDLGSPSNAASRGTAENSGISNSPVGANKEEAKMLRERNESMGGAPNVGTGMSTGTGAGSTVGKKIKNNR